MSLHSASGRSSPTLILLPPTVASAVLASAWFWPDRTLLVAAVAANAAALTLAVALALRQRRRPVDASSPLPPRVTPGQSDARHRVTLRSIGDAVIVADKEGRVELLNPVAEQLTGWSQEEALGRPMPEVFRILNETTREPGENPVARVLQEGVALPLANHTLLIARDGVERPIADAGSPIRDDQGEILGVVLVFRDQTQERDAQRALQASHALLQAVIEGSADPILIKDREGRYVRLNSAAAVLTGKPTAEALGQDDRGLFPPERARILLAEDRAIIEHGTPLRRDESVTGADGRLRHFSVHKGPVPGPDGAATGIWCIAHDITELKYGELALQEQEQRLRLAIKTTHVGIWEWDLKTNRIRWDEEMFRIYGLPATADGLVNYTDWQVAVTPEEILRQEAVMQDTIARKGSSSRAFSIRRARDGAVRHLETFEAVRLDADGNAAWLVGTNFDVTHRKVTETALQKERARLASILFAAEVGTWEWNVPTGETVFNERWAGILGYELRELSPVSIETWRRLAHPEDLKVSGDLQAAHFRHEIPYYECEARMRHKLGHWVWVLDRGQVVTWSEDGKPLVMQGTHTDITARKQAELELRRTNENLEALITARTAALRASEERMALAFQAAQDGIWDWNLETNEVYFSPRYQEMLGLAPGEMEPSLQAWERLVHPDDLARAMPVVSAVIGGGREFTVEFRMRHKAGHYVDILARGLPVRREADGPAIRLVGTHLDLTERKRSAAELDRTRRNLLEAQKIAHVGSFEYLAATRETIWSEEEYRIYGLDPALPSPSYDELLANHIHPDDAARMDGLFKKAIANQSEFEHEHRVVRPDGRVRWVSSRAHPYCDAQGRLERYLGTTLDITVQRQAESAVLESESRLRTVIEHSQDGINLFDLRTGRYVLLSPAQVALTGFTLEEINRFSAAEALERIHPDDRQASLAYQQAAANGENAGATLEYRWKIKRGEYRWMSDSRRLVRDPQGRAIGLVGVSRDITGRKQADEELRRHRESLEALVRERTAELMAAGEKTKAERQRFLDMLDTLPVMLHLIRADYAIEWANHAFREAMGDLVGQRYHQGQFGRAHPGAEGQAFLPLQTGQPHYWESTLPDGRTLEIGNFPFVAADGSPAVLEMDIDITEQKKAKLELEKVNATLRASEARFRSLVETSFDWLWQVDTAGRYTYVSPRVRELLGYEPSDLLGRTPFDLLLPADAEREREAFQGLSQRRERMAAHEIGNLHRSGHLVMLETNAAPVFAEDGTWLGYTGMARDITARREAERELRLRGTALETAANAILILAADGTIRWSNPAFTTLFGWSQAEAAGQDPRRLLDSGQHDGAFYAEMDRVLQSGQTWRGEIVNRRKDGKRRTEDVTMTPVRDAAGSIQHYVVIKQDITERKAAEAQRLHLQRMESIGTLAGGVAHDLNNILSPILIVPEILKLRTLDAKDRELLEMVQQSARRGSEIIRQLLTFSRRVEGEFMLVQPRHLLREMMAIMRETFPRELEVELTAPATLPLIKADPTQMHQVLLNLCVNARDAMPEGGRLSLNAAELTIADGDPELPPGIAAGPFILIEVSDTGHGIPADIRDRIFDPFFTTKPVGKGTGLGLSTVQGILNGHGGFITFESRAGDGATFRVHLPVAEAAETQAPGQTVTAPLAVGSATVLVVDDELSIRRSFTLGLEAHGYRVLTAAHGGEGLEVFRQNQTRINAVLTDLMMPTVNGIAFAKALRAISPHLPIIAVSGLAEARYADELKAIGVTRILAKPCTIEVILQAVAEVLAEKRTG